jgi:hypothetical protein
MSKNVPSSLTPECNGGVAILRAAIGWKPIAKIGVLHQFSTVIFANLLKITDF